MTAPMSSVLACGLAAMYLHELFHAVTARLCGVPVKQVGISRRGFFTRREAGPRWANALISVAGPAGNIAMGCALPHCTLAWVSVVCGVYNLLPIPNSDGTRLLALLKEGAA